MTRDEGANPAEYVVAGAYQCWRDLVNQVGITNLILD
jgi:hypothetical protein